MVTDAMSYLDDPRVFFAAERTLLAWQRTTIALIGLGFVVERFGLFMRVVLGNGGKLPPEHASTSLIFGVVFLLAGAAIAVISTLQYCHFIQQLSEPELPRGHMTWPGPALNALLAIMAVGLAAWFVITA
jgi:putative membrane protein